MKRLLLPTVLLVLLASCKKQPDIQPEAVSPDKQLETSATLGKECYLFTKGKDTITLSMVTTANSVNGELNYDWFEKDSNYGTFSGIFINDTLFADYTFKSEGLTSVRETVFLKRNNTLLEGHGDMEEKNNKQVFKDRKHLSFDSSIEFAKIPCR